MKKKIIANILEYHSIDLFSDDEKKLITDAKKSVINAYAPYSNFKVGAAVLLRDGNTIGGNNQENAAYPTGICAEQVALFYANANFPDSAVITIVITALKNKKFVPVSPCGKCRQVMIEIEERYKTLIKIILYGEDKIYVIESAKSLLPFHFGKENLA